MLARLSTKNKVLLVGAALGVGVLGMAALYTAASLSWAYSEGDRSGTVLKVSNKGWVCKTWEGELAMAMVAGGVPGDQGGISTSTWKFTVRDDGLIDKLTVKNGPLEQLTETAEILSRLQPAVETLTPTADTLESAVDTLNRMVTSLSAITDRIPRRRPRSNGLPQNTKEHEAIDG